MIYELLIAIVLLPIFLVSAVFIRAISARAVTGKWPHQDDISREIFEDMP